MDSIAKSISRWPWRLFLPSLALATTITFGTTAADAAPVAHEYVPPPNQREKHRWLEGRGLPDHIFAGSRRLRRPAESPGDQSLIGPDARAMREREVPLDRTTTHDGQLRYDAIFNPSVVPFKRSAAFDAVNADFKLTVRDTTLRPFPPKRQATPPNHDIFWGTLTLVARAGEAIALPSVAPNATIVGYRTRPQTTLRFYKDSADNHWVKATGTARLRLVFITHAPKRYFSTTIPPLITVDEIPPRLRPILPAIAKKEAAVVLEHLRIRKGSIGAQLRRLVAYFRNFQAKPLQRRTSSIYLDIALSQRGVCRHRAFAFMVTAQALGIPTRYVQNEAHAFTEVFIPRRGWSRIDLGGASTGLHVQHAQERVVHQSGPDPFPRPSRFRATYSQLRGQVTGLPPSPPTPDVSRAPAQSLRRFSSPAIRPMPGGSSASTGSEQSHGQRRIPSGTTPGSASGSPAAYSSTGTAPAPSRDPVIRRATRITIHSPPKRVLRGETIHVWGRVVSGVQAIVGLRVEVYLSRDRRTAIKLGETLSKRGGVYSAQFPIPHMLKVGAYRLYAATPGNDRYGPSLSK